MDGLTGTMTKAGSASKRFGIGNLHVRNDSRAKLEAKLAGDAARDFQADSGRKN
jgi:hypothetical protein